MSEISCAFVWICVVKQLVIGNTCFALSAVKLFAREAADRSLCSLMLLPVCEFLFFFPLLKEKDMAMGE